MVNADARRQDHTCWCQTTTDDDDSCSDRPPNRLLSQLILNHGRPTHLVSSRLALNRIGFELVAFSYSMSGGDLSARR